MLGHPISGFWMCLVPSPNNGFWIWHSLLSHFPVLIKLQARNLRCDCWVLTVCVCLGYSLCCRSQLPWLDVELKLVPIYVAVLVAALLAQSKVAIIITGGVGKNGSTVAVSEVTFYVCVWKWFSYNVRARIINCEILIVCFLTGISQVSLKFYFLWKTQMRRAKCSSISVT